MRFGLIPPMAITVVALTLLGCNQDMKRYGVELDRTNVVRGMDVNGNGVRDDIDLYISKNFTPVAQRNAVIDLVLSYQKALMVNKENIAAVQSVSNQYSGAMFCVFRVFPDARLNDGTSLPLILQSMVVNTDQRRFEYDQYNKVLRGYVSPSPKKITCK